MNQVLARAARFIAACFRRVGTGIRRHPFAAIATVPLLAIAVAAALVATYVASLVPLTPDVAGIGASKPDHPSLVLTADGQTLVTFRHLDRQWVKLADVSPNVIHALLDTEDHRFYEHSGMDVRRTLAAALHTLEGDREGGSTITQQLARNLYPQAIGRAPTITRKIKEAITALKIERRYSKDQILETYLNTVPFLYNARGIEIAARTYFGKRASELDVPESATLVGMLKGTTYYNPVLNPEHSLQRRNTVLAQMVRYGELTREQFDALKDQPLALHFQRQQEDLGPAPHLAQQVRRWLADWAERNGYDMYADGLVVHTTIDSRLQALATQAVTRQADRLQAIADKAWTAAANRPLLETFLRETARYKEQRKDGASDAQAIKVLERDREFVQALWNGKKTLQAGFMAMDPATGAIKAWVGSRDFEQDQFDHVAQARRQPGSTFKPFVYGTAFEEGMSPDEMLMDAPVEIQLDDHTMWRPLDIEPPSNQPMSLRDGLVFSKNTITAQLMARVGPVHVAQVARAMGIRQSRLDAVPSLALGTSPVTLKEMVTGYATIANSGNYVEPMLVTRIEQRGGRVLADFQPKAPQEALAGGAAQTLLDVMRGVVDRGTGVGIRRRFGLRGDLAGKTGTTQDYTDGWFILMHPQLVSGAWVGFNDNRITMRSDSWGQGAHNALYVVGDFMQHAEQAKLLDAQATFAAPHLQPRPFDPSLYSQLMSNGSGPVYAGLPQDANMGQTIPTTMIGSDGMPVTVLEPIPARPVITVPSPAVLADAPPGTNAMSGPPAQRRTDLAWPQDALPVAPRHLREAGGEYGAPVGDMRAGLTERPAATILSPDEPPRRGRAVAVIVPRGAPPTAAPVPAMPAMAVVPPMPAAVPAIPAAAPGPNGSAYSFVD